MIREIKEAVLALAICVVLFLCFCATKWHFEAACARNGGRVVNYGNQPVCEERS